MIFHLEMAATALTLAKAGNGAHHRQVARLQLTKALECARNEGKRRFIPAIIRAIEALQ